MFSPPIAKPHTKAAANPANKSVAPRSALVAHPTGHREQEAVRRKGNIKTSEGPRGVAWNFTRIPTYSLDQANRPQALSPQAATWARDEALDALRHHSGVPLDEVLQARF